MKLSELANEIQEKVETFTGLQIPKPHNDRFMNSIPRIHESGHFALVALPWYLEWAIALREYHGESFTNAPWVPHVDLPFDLLPDETGVRVWSGILLEMHDFAIENLEKASLGSHADCCTSASYYNVPKWGRNGWSQLKDWEIDPINDSLFPIDDGFSLPHPTATEFDLIVENWEAIALQYQDKTPPGTVEFVRNVPPIWQKHLQMKFPKQSVIFV